MQDKNLIEKWLSIFASVAWGWPLLILLVGGGLFFLIYSGFLPLRKFRSSINVLRGKFDDASAPGEINHFQALSSALAATVGMGNVGGVAVAITMGGPGAVFWMWVSAVVGMATKFFTCTLAVLYRGKDSEGNLQGGPMYFITEGLGKKWKPLAVLFSLAGMFGTLPLFQVNQLTQIVHEVAIIPAGVGEDQLMTSKLITGIVIAFIVSLVIFGGLKRIAHVASRLVPSMVALYLLLIGYILIKNYDDVIPGLAMIFYDAFTGKAIAGGAVGAVIEAGIRRGAFSNEAGIGTAPMAHGAARTNEPVREGLVAMLGPFIDTIIVCTLTSLAILVTNTWQTGQEEVDGITITVQAFHQAIPGYFGSIALTVAVSIFALTTLFTYSYYGTKCFGYLFGAHRKHIYNYIYVVSIVIGALASIGAVVDFIDGMFALMAFPTMIAALLLAPSVKRKAKNYFKNY